MPPDVLKILKTSALPGELEAVARAGPLMREWFLGFVQKHKGKSLRASALRQLDPLNRVLERDEVFGQVARVIRFRDRARLPSNVGRAAPLAFTGESLLQPIAHELADVICNEDFNLIRACEGHACTLMFVDHTKSHRRRWCSMAVCGNRAKQAAQSSVFGEFTNGHEH